MLAFLLCALPAHAQYPSAATQKLFEAVKKNDIAAVRASIADGADISARNVRDLTPIDLAVNSGYYDIVQYLLTERNKRTKERLGTADALAPGAPPSRSPPVRAPVVAEKPASPSPAAASAQTAPPQTQPAEPPTADPTVKTTDLSNFKPPPQAVPAAKPVSKPVTKPVTKPVYEEKPSAFARLGEQFLSRFDFIADLFRGKTKKPAPGAAPQQTAQVPKPAAPQQATAPPSVAVKPAPAETPKPAETVTKTAAAVPAAPPQTPSPAPSSTPSPPDESEAMMQEAVEPPVPVKAPATYMAKPKPGGIEPPKPDAAPAPDVLAEAMEPAPKPITLPDAVPDAAPDAKPEAAAGAPAPAPPPAQAAAKPSTPAPAPPPLATSEDASAFKQLTERFVERFRELFGLEKTRTAEKQPEPAPKSTGQEKPTGFLDAFKQTVERIRAALLPDSKTTRAASKAPAPPQGPIILARPGETPPPPPGQLLNDDPSKFADVPEGTEPGKTESAVAAAPAIPAPPSSEPPSSKPKEAQKDLSPTEAIEKDLAELVESQIGEEKKTAAKRPRHQDKILANKEIEDALTQLAGSIKDLPPEPKAAAKAAQPAERKGPITQKQAERDVLDLLMNEAERISGKAPATKTAEKKPATPDSPGNAGGPLDSKEVNAALSQLVDNLETVKDDKKAAPTPAKKTGDELADALANIDSLSLTTPEPDKSGSAKPAPGKPDTAIELPGLAPGPMKSAADAAKPAPLAQQTSPLDKLPPIKQPSTENRQPTEIGSRLRREAEKVSQQKPDFIERMTNVLQLNEGNQAPPKPAADPKKAQVPTSPETPGQWTATVVKTARLDTSREPDPKKRKKLQGPDQFLSGVTLTLGQSLKIGKEPLAKPKTGPDTRKPCIEKREGALAFCVENIDWPSSINPYFEINTIMYQGTQAVVRYDEGRASNFFTLFDSRAYGAIVDYYTKRYGPPTQRLQRGIAPLAQPRRANPVSIWRSIDPTTSLVTTLEIRQFDDSRVGFPDTRRGTIMLYHAWSEPIFPQLSALELMVLKPKEDSDTGAAPTPVSAAGQPLGVPPGGPQASAPQTAGPNPFSSFP